MFGFIKNFFAGIFGFFGRLFGFKKSEYFLDLDGSQPKEPAKVEPAKSAPVAAASLATPPAPSAKAEEPKAKKSPKAKKEPAVSAAPAPEPVKVAPASTNGKAPAVSTFAPDYLVPTSTSSRRLPGPSMNNFRDMARQMKRN